MGRHKFSVTKSWISSLARGRQHTALVGAEPGRISKASGDTIFKEQERVVTVINTDTDGGTGIGLVAMIEVVALMIGDIVQRYSETQYLDPAPFREVCSCAKVVPKVYIARAAARPCCSFRKAASISLPIYCVI